MNTFKVIINFKEIIVNVETKQFETVVPFHFQVRTNLIFGVNKSANGADLFLLRFANSREISLKPSIYLTKALKECSVR